MLGQFLHVFSLNELVDISKIYAKELSRMFSLKLLPIISGLVSFSGVSIIMQSMAFLKETKIKMHNFIFGKVVHSILSIFLCQILVIFAV